MVLNYKIIQNMTVAFIEPSLDYLITKTFVQMQSTVFNTGRLGKKIV